MKRLFLTATGSLLLLSAITLTAPAAAQDSNVPDTLLTPAQWIEFNQNVQEALVSDNTGVKEGGVRMVIRYGRFLNLDREAIFSLMRMYRDGTQLPARRMAVRALGSTQDRWAIEFLDMLAPTEPNATLKKTIEDTVTAYWESHGGNPYN